MNKLTVKSTFNNMLKLFAFSVSFLYITACVAAENLHISDGYIRATIPGTQISSAYMTIANHSQQDVKLVAVKSDISNRIEIHEHVMSDGMMKMRQVDALLVKSHESIVLQPSGYHLMIFNLDKPLKPEQKVNITLIFNDKSEVDLELPVQSIKKRKKKAHAHHH